MTTASPWADARRGRAGADELRLSYHDALIDGVHEVGLGLGDIGCAHVCLFNSDLEGIHGLIFEGDVPLWEYCEPMPTE